jgi:hypothetical protein
MKHACVIRLTRKVQAKSSNALPSSLYSDKKKAYGYKKEGSALSVAPIHPAQL